MAVLPPTRPAGIGLRACEEKFLDWLRRQAMPYGRLTARVTVEYQDGVPVSIQVASLVEVTEKFR